MYKSKKVLIFLAVLIFSASSLLAQGLTSSATTEVKVNVREALLIENVGSTNLIFDDILFGSGDAANILVNEGVNFRVTGPASGDIFVTYSSTPITYGTTNLIFTPVVDYSGGDNTYNPIGASLGSGDGVAMADANSDGVGEIFLWLGGAINVTSTTPAGLYEGIFTMTVAY